MKRDRHEQFSDLAGKLGRRELTFRLAHLQFLKDQVGGTVGGVKKK